MSKRETSKEVAAIAARILSDPSRVTESEIRTMAGSCLSQREDDYGGLSREELCNLEESVANMRLRLKDMGDTIDRLLNAEFSHPRNED